MEFIGSVHRHFQKLSKSCIENTLRHFTEFEQEWNSQEESRGVWGHGCHVLTQQWNMKGRGTQAAVTSSRRHEQWCLNDIPSNAPPSLWLRDCFLWLLVQNLEQKYLVDAGSTDMEGIWTWYSLYNLLHVWTLLLCHEVDVWY